MLLSKYVLLLCYFFGVRVALHRLSTGLPRRFRSRLDIPDFTGEDLAEIVKKKAASDYHLRFAGGLTERLAAHITHTHGKVRKVLVTDHLGPKLDENTGQPVYEEESDISQSNGGLAVLLLESAIERLQVLPRC